MSKKNKDSLEDFFRERAQSYNLEFNEGDWNMLKAQLDVELPVVITFWASLKKYWIVPALLLLIPISWLLYDQLTENTQGIETASILKEFDSRPIDQNNGESIKIPNQDASSEEVVNSGSNINEAFFNNSNQQSHDNTYNNNESISKLESYENSKNKDIGYVVSENGADTGIGIFSFQLPFLPPIAPGFSIDKILTADPEEIESVHKISPTKTKKTSLNLGIGYSPDFSTVGIGNFVAPGSRWAAIGEFGFSKRFLLNTGIVWVSNKYEAYGEDYHAPSRYWKNGIMAEEAYGECKMIDIPLNLRYNIILMGKHQLFVSGGASTYFVLKEDYYFHYELDDPDLPDHWGTDKMTVYPFGIINFSFGYQYELSRKSSFQIEPFIKIPTSGIGWGNVDLHTIGVYFMYKYQIVK